MNDRLVLGWFNNYRYLIRSKNCSKKKYNLKIRGDWINLFVKLDFANVNKLMLILTQRQ